MSRSLRNNGKKNFKISKWVTNNRPDKNNNPFNLKIWTAQKYWLTQNWSWKDDQNHLIFNTPEEWLQASLQVIEWITKKFPWITIWQLKWAEDKNWNKQVAKIANVDINTPIEQINKANLAQAIAKQEWYTWKINIW